MTAPVLAVWDPRRVELSHHVSLEAYSRNLKAKADDVVRGAFAEVNSTLLTRYSDLTAFQRQRAVELYARTGQILAERYGDVSKLIDGEMFNLAAVEGEFAQDLLQARLAYAGIGIEANTTRLTQAQLGAIADYPVQGARLGDWWKQQGAQAAFRVKTGIQQGLVQGEGIDKIVRRIGVAEGASRRGTQMLVRTAVTAVSTQAQVEGLQSAGSDVSEEYEIVATLDDRTSEICQSLDGQRFRWDDPKGLKPPFHLNCRTTIVAVVNWEKLGVPDPTRGLDITRASQNGPVVGRGKAIDYGGWLKSQPVSVQDDILGVAKGKLFRRGDATLADLVRSDGTAINLRQLQRKLQLSTEEMPTSIRSPASARGPITPGLDLADFESASAVDAAQAAALATDYAAMTDAEVLEWAMGRPGFYLTRAGQIDKLVPGFKVRVQRLVGEFKKGGGVLPPKPPPKIRGGPPGAPPEVLPPPPPEVVTLPKLRTADDYAQLTDKQVQLWASERKSFYLTRAAQLDKKLGTAFKVRAREIVKRMGFVELEATTTEVLRVGKVAGPFESVTPTVPRPAHWPADFTSRVAEMIRDFAGLDLRNVITGALNVAASRELQVTEAEIKSFVRAWGEARQAQRKAMLEMPAAPKPATGNQASAMMDVLGIREASFLAADVWEMEDNTRRIWELAKKGYAMPERFAVTRMDERSWYGSYNSWSQRIEINTHTGDRRWTRELWADSHRYGKSTGFHPYGGPDATVTHEFGHLQHNVNTRDQLGTKWHRWWSDAHHQKWRAPGIPANGERIAARVSDYATYNPLEFVAETFTGLNHGVTYDEEVMALYRALHGPKVLP